MAKVEVIMPKLGESIIEATVLKWLKQPGEKIEADDTLLEIATDKVDSEVPSPESGVLVETRYNEGDVVPIGEVIAVIETDASAPVEPSSTATQDIPASAPTASTSPSPTPPAPTPAQAQPSSTPIVKRGSSNRFYSPLVRSIAQKEGISMQELESIAGTGKDGRVTKNDILGYVQNRTKTTAPAPVHTSPKPTPSPASKASTPPAAETKDYGPDVEVVQMDRMRQLIAKAMQNSWQTIPHVTSYVEADVTAIWQWRNRVKKEFQDKYGVKLTFTPIFFEAVAKALRDFPMVNSSIDGDKILLKKRVNIGMATALPNGNLIVPVIKDADQRNLAGLANQVNDLATKARNNKLAPDDIQGGTFTITNVGSYGDLYGTPIINFPQTAILGTGLIRKMPAVLETPEGDVIAIRYKMILSLSYDHRVIDGFLGGSFANKVKYYLEHWDIDQAI